MWIHTKIDHSKLFFFQGKPVQEVYVFKDPDRPANEVPVVLLFAIVNKDFRKFSAPGVPRTTAEEFSFSNFDFFANQWDFHTLRFNYSEEAVERLCQNIEFNIHNNLELIKQEISNIADQRRCNKHSDTS